MEQERTVRRCDECGRLCEERRAIEVELVSYLETTALGKPPSYVVERHPMHICPDCARQIRIRSEKV